MRNLLLVAILSIVANATVHTCKTVDIKENKHLEIIASDKVKVEYIKSYKKIFFEDDLYTYKKSYSDGPIFYQGSEGHLVELQNGNILLEPYHGNLMYLYSDCI